MIDHANKNYLNRSFMMKLQFPDRNKKIHTIPDAIIAIMEWIKELDNPLWNFVRYLSRNHSVKDSLRMAFKK